VCIKNNGCIKGGKMNRLEIAVSLASGWIGQWEGSVPNCFPDENSRSLLIRECMSFADMFLEADSLKKPMPDQARNTDNEFIGHTAETQCFVDATAKARRAMKKQIDEAVGLEALKPEPAAKCECEVKLTGVAGMCIIYPKSTCPVHWELHGKSLHQGKR
jgi:hypothetical protein